MSARSLAGTTLYFAVKVPADGEQTVRYRVRYTW
jgi:hypothetical protein